MGEGFSYISAHTIFDRNSFPKIVLKLVTPNLDKYLESGRDPYYTIELNMIPFGTEVTVNDVVEASYHNQDIAFCGIVYNEAYIGVVDQHLQAIPGQDIQVYNFRELYSIVEVPGLGYIACGENQSNQGVIMVVKYNLQVSISYEYPVPLTQVIFDEPNQHVIFCGINRRNSEISVYNISLNDLLSGISAQGFTYYPTTFGPISLANDGIRNVRMAMFDNGYIAISASGSIPIPGGNTSNAGSNGFLHVNTLDGRNPVSNLVFNWNSDRIHFRDIQVLQDLNLAYLLFYHNGSLYGEPHNPVLIEADILNPTNWFGIKIDANPTGVIRDYTRMFARDQCHRLGLGGFENEYAATNWVNSRNHYADIQTLPLRNGWFFEFPITNFIFDSPPPMINSAPGFTGINTFRAGFTLPVAPTDPLIINYPMALLHNIFDQAQCLPMSPSPSPRSQEIEEANIVIENSAEIRFYGDRVEFSDISGYTQYAVYDMMGRKILDSKLSDNTISFSPMSKGMYILRLLKADGDFEQHKFIVK